jgi:endonuclease YncB( thermonuclease family)
MTFRYVPFLKNKTTRKELLQFFVIVMVISFILVGICIDKAPATNTYISTDATENVRGSDVASISLEGIKQDVIEDEKNVATSAIYKVDRVIDGDTVDVVINGKIERLRLIGIDTPETVHPSKPVECYGTEASNKAKELLEGSWITLEKDDSQGEVDTYGRLLRYVFLSDGSNFNLLMVREGYAYEYTYDGAYTYQSEFKHAQEYAAENRIGLWGDVCQTNEVS